MSPHTQERKKSLKAFDLSALPRAPVGAEIPCDLAWAPKEPSFHGVLVWGVHSG